MNQQEILEIMDIFGKTNIERMELKTSEYEIKLEKEKAVINQRLSEDYRDISNNRLNSIDTYDTSVRTNKTDENSKVNDELEASKSSGLNAKSNIVNFANANNVAESKVENNIKDNIENTVDEVEKIKEENLVRSPIVGTFYSAPAEDKEPYVVEGSVVKKGDVLCLLEAMKMMSEVTAPKNGVIKKCLVMNEEVVEFNKPLFVIE